MFITLLAVTFALALVVTTIVARVFRRSIAGILERIFVAEIAAAWQRYMTFAIYVVGISGGVRIWELEKYITARKEEPPLVLNMDRWVLELYRTIIETLQSTAWLLLAFFVVAIIAYGLSRSSSKGSGPAVPAPEPAPDSGTA
jgi:hypothetical protein